MPVGLGFDIHRLVKNRKLMLGGVEIPYKKGLVGHSDADVVLHSICDAMLGASGLGDIGEYFPDTDPKYKNMPSTYFIKQILNKVKNKWKIRNVDVNILAQEPRLGKLKQEIRKNVAKLLKIPAQNVNIKAKTTENMGIIGNKKAISAVAIVELIRRK